MQPRVAHQRCYQEQARAALSESILHCICPKSATSNRAQVKERSRHRPSIRGLRSKTNPTKMIEGFSIEALLQLEKELNSEPARSIERDAKVNLLKFLQISTVKKYEEAYDGLCYELSKEGGLERLRKITPVRSKEKFLQPKVYDLLDCEGAAELEVLQQADACLADAELVKLRLDELVDKVVENLEGCEVRYAEVKSRESTVRKAKKSYGGNVRRVADMARVAVVCKTPELLEQVYMGITGHLQMISEAEDKLLLLEKNCEEWRRAVLAGATLRSILGHVMRLQGKFTEAETLLHRSLVMEEKTLGAEHPVVASSLNHLAALFKSQGKYAEAERLYKRALAIQDKTLGPEHLKVATSLNNLAGVWKNQVITVLVNTPTRKMLQPDVFVTLKQKNQSRHSAAKMIAITGLSTQVTTYLTPEMIFAHSISAAGYLTARDSSQAPEKRLTTDYTNLLPVAQGNYADAEPLYTRSLAVREKVLGPEHPDVAFSLNGLAALLDSQGKYAEAEPLLKRSLAIREKALGPEHPDVASSINNLAALLSRHGKYAEAELLYEQSLAIQNNTLGPEHPEMASSLQNLAALLEGQGKYTEAEPLYQRTLAIGEKALGPEHPAVASSLNDLAALLYRQGRFSEAEPLYRRALVIREKTLGSEQVGVATTLNNLALLLESQGKYVEAGLLYERSLIIQEKALGPEHPDVAAALNNWAVLLKSQGKFAEAEPLYKRALAIHEKVLGSEHPGVASLLNNLAELLDSQVISTAINAVTARALVGSILDSFARALPAKICFPRRHFRISKTVKFQGNVNF
ncbi:unnamed protein product [Laminaria digitata]